MQAVFDPLHYFAELDIEEVFCPLGYPVRVQTNARAVVEAARESWGMFCRTVHTRPVWLRVLVNEDGPAISGEPPVFWAQAHLLTIVDGRANFAVCDFSRGAGFCSVTAATLDSRALFRYYLLEAMAYAILTDLYLAPIHASCVALDGHGVLLCGGPGAGKSTLAFACARRGWTFVTDDACFLVRASHDRMVLGRPHQMRFRESAAELFPELSGRLPRQRPNGKLSVEVFTAELNGIATALQARVDYILFLDYQAGARAEFLPLSGGEIAGRLTESLAPFGETLAQRHASLARLAEVASFRFRYGDLDEAVRRLQGLVRRGQ